MRTITNRLYTGLAVAAFALCAVSGSAQTLFSDDFTYPKEESYTYSEMKSPWEVVSYAPERELPHRWCIYSSGEASSREYRAYIDHGDYSGTTWRSSDYLITPALQLDGKYVVSFNWAASSMALDGKQFDLRVRVIEDGQTPDASDFIFSILDPKMVLESGVQPTDYGWYTVPWVGWANNQSTLDLSPWEGKKVKIVFEYWCNGSNKINNIFLDDVKVYAHEVSGQAEPVASINEWDFGEVYIGSKTVSEVFKISNTGRESMKITGIECPAGFSVITSTAMEDINLGRNEYVNAQIMYDAAMTSATSGNIVIKTNGKETSVAVRATKKMLPDGYTFEGFENCENVFPPAGWSNTGDWRVYSSPIEGYLAAVTSANMNNKPQELITPRLDGSSGSITFEFTYYDYFIDEDGLGADNVVNVYFSNNGGTSWSLLDSFDWNGPYNEAITKKYTKSTDGSDNCFFKISYMPLDGWDTEYGPVISSYFVDSVILPPLYGADAAPTAPELTAPANGTQNIYPRNVELSWVPAQFADGYKVYVGTNGDANDLVNGVDVQDALSYNIPQLAYDKTYNWRIEAYNSKGTTRSATFNFTTQPDASVSTFPYEESFEGEIFPPIGWMAEADNNTKWYRSDYRYYDGSFAAGVQAGLADSHAALNSMDITLPETPMYLTFYWCDASAGVQKDLSGTRVNPTNGSNGIADLDFEILVDGEWTQLAKLSDPSDEDNIYWYRERIDLTPYAGKTIQLRWNRTIFNYFKARTAVVDKITIEPKVEERISLNIDSMDAGKMNQNDSFTTESKFTVLNDGSADTNIDRVEFSGNHFSTSLKPGDVVKSGSGLAFNIQCEAKDQAGVFEETMTVYTTRGASVTMNLRAEVLPFDEFFFGFEYDEYGSLEPKGFITIDEDKGAPISLAMVDYANKGLPQAFVVMNYKKADWTIPYPNTGEQNLVAFAGENRTAYDWLIRAYVEPLEDGEFEFYARNYEHKDPWGYGAVFEAHKARVLVSSAHNDPSDLSKYELLDEFTLNNPEKEEYTKYVVDMSAYKNAPVHLALQHTVSTDGLAAFFDDLTFRHFNMTTGVTSVVADSDLSVVAEGNVLRVIGGLNPVINVYAASGMLAAAKSADNINVDYLPAGIYVVNVKADNGFATVKFIKR